MAFPLFKVLLGGLPFALMVFILHSLKATPSKIGLSEASRSEGLCYRSNLSANADASGQLFEELWGEHQTRVWMSKEEAGMIAKYLSPEHVMWEWGSGGSTTLYPLFVARYYSVEHKLDWFEDVQQRILDANLKDKVVYKYVDQAPKSTNDYPSRGAEFARYIMSVPDSLKFDRVLVDGRTRIQCAVEALWHFRDPESAVLFYHDFWERSNYHLIFWLYDLVDAHTEGQSLAVLRPKLDWKERLPSFPYPDWWIGDTVPAAVDIIRKID